MNRAVVFSKAGRRTRLLSGALFVTAISIPALAQTFTDTYYLPHLSFGGGWQTTITYVNYSTQPVTCQTNFYSDSGGPLPLSLGGGTSGIVLGPGQSIHTQTNASLSAPETRGWAKAQCSGPIKASLLFRYYQGGVATGEASVNATTTPATRFVTFADQSTGIAYANPSTESAQITFTAINSLGTMLASKTLSLPPGAHGAANIGPLLSISSFVGSVQITSTVPIVSLSLNAEAFPVVSSLPPGELDGSEALTYYFPHLALGGGWQTTLTYINYSAQSVTCTTTFYSDSGTSLVVPFADVIASSRTDTLAPGGTIHTESTASLSDAETRGWAKVACTAPIKTSLLFRFYQQGKPTGEASVNAATTPATRFVTFADQTTGVAYANPSAQTAEVTFTAISSLGFKFASKSLTLLAGEHGAANMGPFLALSSFRGSIQVTSTVPIVSLSLNAEAFPVFSSLPPGELDGATPLGGGQISVTPPVVKPCNTVIFYPWDGSTVPPSISGRLLVVGSVRVNFDFVATALGSIPTVATLSVRTGGAQMSGSYSVGESTGSAVLSTVVPNVNARQGLFPSGPQLVQIPIHPQAVPFLNLLPLPNGRDLGNGTGEFFFGSQPYSGQAGQLTFAPSLVEIPLSLFPGPGTACEDGQNVGFPFGLFVTLPPSGPNQATLTVTIGGVTVAKTTSSFYVQ
ncbi:MAG: hypothetical protein HY648_11795 [Acidobacteria bacterium]|nr:hypothetical protein [Acidobacteriota bacterium]